MYSVFDAIEVEGEIPAFVCGIFMGKKTSSAVLVVRPSTLRSSSSIMVL